MALLFFVGLILMETKVLGTSAFDVACVWQI